MRQLEASLSQINEEHCELVKQVVMAKLEREELEDELVKCEFCFEILSSALGARRRRLTFFPSPSFFFFSPHADKIAYA